MADKIIKIRGRIMTNVFGCDKILNFYYQCSILTNQKIQVCLRDLIFIDANMSALLKALLNKLKSENKLDFYADSAVQKKFQVLVNNGFFTSGYDDRKPTGTEVTLRQFDTTQPDEYVDYISNDFLSHPGIKIDNDSKEIIIDSLIEIFGNYENHSKSKYPLHVCGQFYPKLDIMKFTLTDLGVGFLTAINVKDPTIVDDKSAIDWALVEGNTSNTEDLGGLGLYRLKNNMQSLNGILEIATGNSYLKSYKKANTHVDEYRTLVNRNIGSTFNLVFQNF